MNKFREIIQRLFRIIRIINKRLKLKNKNISIISSNCIGGVIYSEIGTRFLSPTINLYIMPSDFVKFVSNLKLYLESELEFIDENSNFPIAKLIDIKIYFMHYNSEEKAREKWNERKKRVNYDNIFIIMVEKDDCTKEDIENFNKLEYKNKIVFTHREMKEYESCFYIKGFEDNNEIGNLMSYYTWFGKKFYDQFNFIKWFNSGGKERE